MWMVGVRRTGVVTALAAIGLLASGCSLLGEDDNPVTGTDGTILETTDPAISATTAGTDEIEAASGSGGSVSTTGDTGPEAPSSETTADTRPSTSSSTVSPRFGSSFCEVPQGNWFEVKFDPGASAKTIDSATIPGQVDMYEIGVGANQILVVSLGSNDADAVVTLFQPDATTVTGAFRDFTVAPTMAGSYWACVTSGDSGSDYQLSVSVIDDNTPTKINAPWCGSDVNDRGEIQFDTGRFSGDVENAVIRGERDLYTITANEGQALDLFLVSSEFNAVFALRKPSGEILIDEVSDFRFPLAESGTYEICIGGTRGNASYVLSLAIG